MDSTTSSQRDRPTTGRRRPGIVRAMRVAASSPSRVPATATPNQGAACPDAWW